MSSNSNDRNKSDSTTLSFNSSNRLSNQNEAKLITALAVESITKNQNKTERWFT